jgi:uracil-DNA glycosylase
LPGEIATCRRFLAATIAGMPSLQAILALGAIAHQSVVRALHGRVAAHPFRHGGQGGIGHVRLFSSYHCSRYNTNTGVLTEEMFDGVLGDVRKFLDGYGKLPIS